MATKRQLNAIDKIVENGGNVSKAMREAGYSPETAKTPSKLTESKGFLEVMEAAGITDGKIVDVLKGGLDATRVIAAIDGEPSITVPDHAIRHKFVETVIKVRGLGQKNDAPAGNIFINNANFNAKKYIEED